MSDHRWQGYSHQQLYDQIHDGPGADASTEAIRRWNELARTLEEIDADLAAALGRAAADWEGAAAETAREGIRPLGHWALDAQAASKSMRDSAEQQAGFIARARAEMPAPVPVTAEDPGTARSFLVHLFGGQTDYEVQEAQQDAAEQRAFEVMRTYEASTLANTAALASFGPPPQVVVDAPAPAPGTGGAVGGPVTISWRTAGTGPGGAGRGGAAPGVGREDGPAGASRSGQRADPRPGGHDDRQDADQWYAQVTEQLGQPGGFFDEQRTLSRPVIGGDPDR